jgi:Uncharacterised protein family (UPF0236)
VGRHGVGTDPGGGGRRKKGLCASLREEIEEELETLLGRAPIPDLDLEAVEMAARRQALRLAARALEQRLNADTSDYGGPELACACGQPARYVGRRAKSFVSVLGPLRLERAYYHCALCGRGFCPRDRALGLEGSSLSPAVTRMTGAVGALVSFQEGSELLKELAGVEVEAKQVERTAEALGAEIAKDEKERAQAEGNEALPSTLYLGIDGTGVPMRSAALKGRTGKQPDGSAKTREVKLCAVWSAESRDAQGQPVRDEGSVTYSAAIESATSGDARPQASEFTQRVGREAQRRRFEKAAQRVVLGDGAPWIWNLSQELFPGALEIVDRFHVKQHLSEVAKALYPTDPHRAQRWAEQQHQKLDVGQLQRLRRALLRQAGRCEPARKCAEYIQRNQHRMRYPEFHAQGLCTSSGVVEAGCKVTVGTRLKRAGMHWSLKGANAIIALRCCRLSGRFEDFWARRAERRAA